jgi:hypothetical protein
VLAIPAGSAILLAPDEPTTYCGSEFMDEYFNKKCNGAVANIAENCCGETPAPTDCDTYRMACIDESMSKGKCTDRNDCEDGCHMFRSMAATCCPHMRARNMTKSSATKLVAQVPDPAAAVPGEPEVQEFYCGAASNDNFYNNICGWSPEAGAQIMEDCCHVEHRKWGGYRRKEKMTDPFAGKPTCEKYRSQCIDSQVKQGKCTSGSDCLFGNQSFEQVTISCCPRSPPPSPPPAKNRLCAAYDN